MKDWIIAPNLINFNTQTTVSLGSVPSSSYTVENIAPGKNGSFEFYVQNGTVIRPGLGAFGTLPAVTSGTCFSSGNPVPKVFRAGSLFELGIVPVPGTCNDYFIFWCAQAGSGICGTALCFSRVTVVPGGPITIFPSSTLVIESAGASSALAISKANTAGNRYIYWIGGLTGIRRFLITSTGVVAEPAVINYTGASGATFEGVEAEIMGNDIIWVDRNGKINHVRLVNGINADFVTQFPFEGFAFGIEFDQPATGFYVAASHNNGVSSGIHHFPDLNNTGSSVFVTASSDYFKSFIEKGYDGNFYAVKAPATIGLNTGSLGKFQANGPVVPAFNGLPVNSGASHTHGQDYFKLPDQIDGEDYSHFSGVAQYNLTGMNINGTPLVDVVPPPAPQFCNNNPINWNATWTGSSASYTIEIYSVDPLTGQKTKGLDFVQNGTGNLPVPIDLRTIGGNTNLFGPHLPGTFAIKVTGTNACGTSTDFMLCYFRVTNAPPPNINLQVNQGFGSACNASQNISSPCAASIYSASLNMGNSQGDITFYQLKIWEVDCATGNTLSTIYQGPQISVSGQSQLTAIALNDQPGLEGFFAIPTPTWCCRCIKVEATIGNACGSSTNTTFIKFSVTCSCFGDGGGGVDRSKDDVGSTMVSLQSLRLSPNPAHQELRFYSIEDGVLPSDLILSIFDSNGKAIMRMDNLEIGTILDIGELPAGYYTYRFENQRDSKSGKLIKL